MSHCKETHNNHRIVLFTQVADGHTLKAHRAITSIVKAKKKRSIFKIQLSFECRLRESSVTLILLSIQLAFVFSYLMKFVNQPVSTFFYHIWIIIDKYRHLVLLVTMTYRHHWMKRTNFIFPAVKTGVMDERTSFHSLFLMMVIILQKTLRVIVNSL